MRAGLADSKDFNWLISNSDSWPMDLQGEILDAYVVLTNKQAEEYRKKQNKLDAKKCFGL